MKNIKTFYFYEKKFQDIRDFHFGTNWPAVYILEDGKEIYIGESTNVYNRSVQHYKNLDRQKLKRIHVITDEEYNKSAALDIESLLIQYISADNKFIVQNANKGLSNHNYFDKEKYRGKFEEIWKELQKGSITINDLVQLENSDLFKYSPFKALTEDQIKVVENISKVILSKKEQNMIVEGKPGTGKTILAIYMIKHFLEDEDYKDLKIGLVVPMVSLRKTIKKVFRNVKGLKSNMVIGPSDVVKEKYDILIVDEAHRLKKRKNITNYKSFDNVNKKLKLGNSGTELDWILKRSKNAIFFYDKNQSVKPSDVDENKFDNLDTLKFELESQKRVKGGEEYVSFVNNLLDKNNPKNNFKDYDFKIYDSLRQMVSDIKEKNKTNGISRVVAGYAWEWVTKKNKKSFDIDIGGVKLRWNSVAHDWVNSENSINEVGCIHTIQGYDLNYTGIIVGPEISYDKNKKEIVIKRENYKDRNGMNGVKEDYELKRYIINIYKTLMTRGVYGTYLYIVDPDLREYFKSVI